MKTIDLSAAMPSLQEVLSLAGEDNILLKTSDGKEFLLAEVDDFEEEVALVRQNQELMQLLEERSRPERKVSLEETRRALGLM